MRRGWVRWITDIYVKSRLFSLLDWLADAFSSTYLTIGRNAAAIKKCTFKDVIYQLPRIKISLVNYVYILFPLVKFHFRCFKTVWNETKIFLKSAQSVQSNSVIAWHCGSGPIISGSGSADPVLKIRIRIFLDISN